MRSPLGRRLATAVIVGAGWIAAPAGCTTADRVLVAGQETPAAAPEVPWKPAGPGADKNEFEASCPKLPACKREQEEPVWCWAACAQMILKYNGQEVSQKELADRIHGHDAEGTVNIQAASYHEVMAALNPDLPKSEVEQLRKGMSEINERMLRGGSAQAGASVNVDYKSWSRSRIDEWFSVNSDVIVEELGRRSPVVVVLSEGEGAALEHAYVLWGAGFAVEDSFVARNGFESTTKGWVVDPFRETPRRYSLRWVEAIDPYDGSNVKLTGAEFRDRVKFMISKERSRQILESEMKLLTVK